MDNKLITGIIGVVVVVALLGSALVPVIDGLTEGEKTTNEGAGWIRMDYVTGANYAVDVSFDDQGNVKVDYGVPGSGMTDTQTHAADEDTILFASSEMSIWLQDGVINILGKDLNDGVFFDQITETGSIAFLTKDGSGSEFNIDAGVTTGLKASTWAYVPKSTGNFGFFAADTPVDMKDYPVAAVGGGFAGVYASNAAAMYGLPLQMQTELDEDGKLIGGTWVKAAPEELNTMEFDPSTITIQPLDPSIIDLDPIDFGGGAQLMSVPTPTYTDGDWGYDLITVDGVTKAAIVSWSGTSAGGITLSIPGTVGGYDVYRLGKNASTSGSSAEVFSNNSFASGTVTNISLPNGLVEIGAGAFAQNPRIGGDLVIPDSVTGIGGSAFRNTRFTTITIGSGVTYINNSSISPFYDLPSVTEFIVDPDNTTYASYGKMIYTKDYSKLCFCPEGIEEIVFHPSVTSIEDQAFVYCQYTGSLTIPNTVTSIGTQSFNSSKFSGEIVIPDSVTSIGQNAFSSMTGSNLTLKIGTGLSSIPTRMCAGSYFTGTLVIPTNVELIDNASFQSTRFDTIVIPSTSTFRTTGSFAGSTFKDNSYLNTVIYASDSALNNNDFQNCSNCQYVLDLSDTEDFTQNRRGLPATITVSDSIGDAIGYVSFIEIGSDAELSGGAAALLIAVPIVVIAGLLVAFVGYSIVKRF